MCFTSSKTSLNEKCFLFKEFRKYFKYLQGLGLRISNNLQCLITDLINELTGFNQSYGIQITL